MPRLRVQRSRPRRQQAGSSSFLPSARRRRRARRLVKRIDEMVAWIEERLSSGGEFPIQVTGVTIGSVSLSKAGGLFAVQMLEKQRQDALSHPGSIPRAILAAIGEKVAQQRDLLEQGVFSGLDAADIFVDVNEALTARSTAEQPAAETASAAGSTREHPARTVPTYLESIPIFDSVLRDRWRRPGARRLVCFDVAVGYIHPTPW
jgi:hypothetical protein